MRASIACDPAAPEAPGTNKRALRTRLLALRTACQAQGGAQQAAALARRLNAMLVAQQCARVGFFWPLMGEFDARPALAQWLAGDAGRIAALPVVIDKDSPLEFHQWCPDAQMRAGRFQIPVPALAAPLDPDLLLIPCVAFDARAYRLGYGGGFYDRTLAARRPRPLAVGIAYDDTEVERLPNEAHDLPLDMILTETRTILPGVQGKG